VKRFITTDKQVGETPLEAMRRAASEAGIPPGTPLTYAGRLDPMALGKLLILIGEECKNQRYYQGLDKEYEFEVLFGFATDTGDILGIPKAANTPQIPLPSALKAVAHNLVGPIELPYPLYSSKTVRGKPLFLWTLENRLDEIEIPVAHTKLYSLHHTGTRSLRAEEIHSYIKERIGRVTPVTEPSKALGADFRRGTILPAWDTLLRPHEGESYAVAQFSAVVSSGTYIRSLAPHIAESVGAKGLAYSIKRTRLGRFFELPFLPSRGFWFKVY
jgi:tRNA pseudouridine(55) synthase